MYNSFVMPKSKLYIVPRELDLRPQVPNNLPVQSTLLVGRGGEVASALGLLVDGDKSGEREKREKGMDGKPEVRLLTLVGPGGVGKTRLALKVAEEALGEAAEGLFEDGVYFVELAGILDAERVAPAIASVLRVGEVQGTPLIETLKAYLQDKRILLLLDNFEQILPAGAMLADLLATCPELRVIVTSRSPLRLSIERELPVTPLALPEVRQHLSVDKLSEFGAVELFVRRASKVEADFELTESNAHAVVEVCRRVDGLPLAIELVAAHARLLSPQSILTRLANPLRLLTGGSHDAGRHQTMRDTIEWSYNLLDEDEQRLFRRLSVFVGGFSLRAAEGICNAGEDISIEASDPLAIEVLEGLEGLIDKNLLNRLEEKVEGDRRLAMLETVREYAWEQLAASGEAEAMQRRHADYYLALAEGLASGTQGLETKSSIASLSAEQDNLRAALKWLLRENGSEASERPMRLIRALNDFLEGHLHVSEFRSWLERALSKARPGATPLRAWCLHRAASLARWQGDFEKAKTLSEESLAMARELGDGLEIANALNI